jgi:hypothetical protein
MQPAEALHLRLHRNKTALRCAGDPTTSGCCNDGVYACTADETCATNLDIEDLAGTQCCELQHLHDAVESLLTALARPVPAASLNFQAHCETLLLLQVQLGT